MQTAVPIHKRHQWLNRGIAEVEEMTIFAGLGCAFHGSLIWVASRVGHLEVFVAVGLEAVVEVLMPVA